MGVPHSLEVALRSPDVAGSLGRALAGLKAGHGRRKWLAALGVDILVAHHVEAAWALLGEGAGTRCGPARMLVLEMRLV